MQYLRPEHPNPQWERTDWRNLNGEWEFDYDYAKTAREKELYKKGALSMKINVPFCPESEMSGIGNKDFMEGVCYRKVINLSKAECEKNVFLHIGASDFDTAVYINGNTVCQHLGGYTPITADLTKFVREGENVIFISVLDCLRTGKQAGGKQSYKYDSYECFYTRTTGIWQTVWLEFVPKSYIMNAKYYTDIDNGLITVTGKVKGRGILTATAFYEGKNMGEASSKIESCDTFSLQIKLSELHLWELGKGRLYDLVLSFNEDTVKSYFGMRSAVLDGMKFRLNGQTVFQRLVLDQGYYPDGLYTARTDEILKKDIELSMSAGFNGARLHQKVFEPRFLYHCDKAGYMVWDELGNWGLDYKNIYSAENYIAEWIEVVERDFNHPSIVGWCPFNETWAYIEGLLEYRLIEDVYRITKQLDPTRFCVDASGHYHVVTDIFDVHDYEGDPEKLREYYKDISKGIVKDQMARSDGGTTQTYRGEPVCISEYGGISWGERTGTNWGYGDAPKSDEEFFARYKGLTDVLLDNPDIMGFCYTQLYDVEQEINGLYTYDRTPKFDMERIKQINIRKAAIEK